MSVVGVDPKDLHAAWDEIRLSGHLTEGKYVRLLEEAVEAWGGIPACAVNSAGTGLYTMLRMSGVAVGKPVAVPVNTFFATGAMPIEAGYSVIPIDCTPDDLSMCVNDLEVQPVQPSAVILTHVGGKISRHYEQIAAYCMARSIPLFEDAAHVLGVRVNSIFGPGRMSKGAVFSLYPTKAVPAGEGGIIVSRDPDFLQACREFRNYGKYRDKEGVLRHRSGGFNFRMDEWTAAVGYLQMKRLNELLEKREEAAHQLGKIIQPINRFARAHHRNWYKYPVDRLEADCLGIKKFSGHVYQTSDQLISALNLTTERRYIGAELVASMFACLPLDEGMYAGQTTDEILRHLRS
jgi:dTDP-4-amino-4,6-dideoxygalactose transaminase